MTAADRRMEIISILVVSGHTTSKELAQEFGVTNVSKAYIAYKYCMMFQSSHMGIPYTQSRVKAEEFSSWTATNRTAIRLPCPSRRNSWKCMPKQRAGKRKY